MKTFIEYIISLTAIFLLVIFLSVPTVDTALAGNNLTSPSSEDLTVPQTDLDTKLTTEVETFDFFDKTLFKIKKSWDDVFERPIDLNEPNDSLCPEKNPQTSLKHCDFSATKISYALSIYQSAVSLCKNGGQTQELIEKANKAWHQLEEECQNNKGL